MIEIFSSETKLFNLEDVNKNIARFKVPLCYVGIANKFDFSKEVIEGMVDTIKGSAVLTYYDDQIEDFGGHEGDLYNSKGVKKRTPELHAIGFTIYDQNAWWETFNFDGAEREYYTTFVYLWKDRYPELNNLKQVYQSMEVEIDYDNPVDGIKKVKSASFQGMAMLGSSVLPAFKNSTFIKFSSDDLNILKQEFEQTKIKPSEKLKITKINQNNNFPLEGGENDNMHGLTAKQLERRLISGFEDFKYINGTYQYQRYCIDDYNENSVTVHDNQDEKIYRFQYIFKDDICQIDMSTKIQMENDYKPATFAQKVEVFLDKEKWGQGDKLKIDKSKDKLSDSDWGSVNKTSLRNSILSASNYKTLVKDVYLLVEDGWEDSPSSHLKFPVMEISDNTLIYNKGGLSSALAYAEKGNETEVINKLKSIYKKMGLQSDTFSERSEVMKDFKALYSQMKKSESKFAFDDSIDDSNQDQMTILIDSDAGCIYLMDNDGGVTKIPFVIIEDNDDTIALKEDLKEIMPNSKEMIMGMSKMMGMEKEKLSAQLSAKDAELETQKQEMSAQLSAQKVEMDDALLSKDGEIGKAFASISSMETAMAESATVMAQKEAQIEELSKQLKGKETAEKMSKVEDFLSKKEFSVFSAEEKQSFKDKSIEMSLEELETMTYSEFGKKIKDKIDFSSDSQKFSFMYVENKPLNIQDGKDVYAEIREKNSK